MTKLSILFLTLALLLVLAVPARAAGGHYLVDNADLLTAAQERVLSKKLEEVSEKFEVDVVVVTADDLDGKSSQSYADDFFDYGGYGEDGILWLIDMEHRKSTFSTTGTCIDSFPDATLEQMQDSLAPMLTDGEYRDAIEKFASLCEENLGFDPGMALVIALVVGLLVAAIATAVMRSQLKSVRSKADAADYMKAGSLQLTEARDFFLYHTITRVAKPKDNGSTTHSSSSGRSHGGSSRGF